MANVSTPRLPRYPSNSAPIKPYLDQLVSQVERQLGDLGTAQGGEYDVAAFSQLRTFNPGTASALDVARVLATLIQDLQVKGSIG